MPRFYGKLYPGRLNQQELYKHRAPEQYEAVMTDLYFMGIITKEQFEQYTHRWINPYIHGRRKPVDYDPFPTLAKNYYVRDFYGDVGTAFTVDPTATPPTDPGTTNGELQFMLAYNDGKPPQPEPPIPVGWYLMAWEWNAEKEEWLKAYYPQPVAAEERHYVQLADGTYQYIHLTGEGAADIPTVEDFVPNEYILPDLWIDAPAKATTPGTTIDVRQINLQSGQFRLKPTEDGTRTEHVRLLETIQIPTENTKVYNGQLPLVTPQNTPPQYALVLNVYPDKNILYKAKDILSFDSESNFPTTGDITKLYYALDDTTQYYYWNGAAYAAVTSTLRGQAFMYAENGWLEGVLDTELTPDTTAIINFDNSYLQMDDDVFPVPSVQGFQLIQLGDQGLVYRLNLPQFFYSCIIDDVPDGTDVEINCSIHVRYEQ